MTAGIAFLPPSAPLTGLNYYDGRFLRADDLNLERTSQRRYAEFGNRAGAPGVVYGFDVDRQGTRLTLSGGLALDPKGRVLHLPDGVEAEIADLLGEPPGTAAEPVTGFAACAPPATGSTPAVVGGSELYLVCIAYAEGRCGESEVFGRACDGCVTPTDRPYVVPGVSLLLLPLVLTSPLPTLPGLTRPEVHLRSQVAAAYFADERARAGSLLSAAGLRTTVWGGGATAPTAGDAVPVGVLGWNGSAVTFLDRWTARRERIGTGPQDYWAGRTERRPLAVFLAQVLQFQSQLAELGADAVLPDAGIVELSPAGYLPVDPAAGLRPQLERRLGAGVDLRFCAVRRDQVGGELERAQHLDRISLLRGLTGTAAPELVDILVPDGVVAAAGTERTGYGFAVDLAVGEGRSVVGEAAADPSRFLLRGVGRLDLRGGITVRTALAGSAQPAVRSMARIVAGLAAGATGWEETLTALRALRFGTDAPSPALLRRVGRDVADRAAAQRASRTTGRVVSLPGASPNVAAVSAYAWVARDPFVMADHDAVAFRLMADLALPAAQPVTVKLVVDGRLVRNSARAGPIGPEVLVTVTGFADAVTTGIAVEPGGGRFDQDLVFRRGTQDGRRLWGIGDDESHWLLGVGWQGDPVEAEGALVELPRAANPGDVAAALAGIPTPPAGIRVVAAFAAVESDAITEPGEPHRDSAIAALQILSGLYPDDPDYVERRYAELFPAVEPAGTLIRPTTDWVLFRRRLRKDCEGAGAPPAPAGRVATWVTRAADVDQAAVWAESLGDAPWTGGGEPLTFEAGTGALLTAPATWRQGYQAADGGSVIRFAGYAVAPGAPDVPVGVARARAVVDALAPLAILDPADAVDLVPVPPAGQIVAGTDGSVFLVTYEPDPVRVITVDGIASPELADAVLAGDEATVTAAPPSAVPVLVDVAAVGPVDDDAVRAALTDRISELQELHESALTPSYALWIHSSLAGERLEQALQGARRVLPLLGVGDPAAVEPKRIDFPLAGTSPVRLYVAFRAIVLT